MPVMRNMCKNFLFILIIPLFLINCEKVENGIINNNVNNPDSNLYIAGYSRAKEGCLRSIPQEYLNAARNNLHIAYQHTSHGTHVSRGMFGLQDYKSGDKDLFGITNNSPVPDKLDFRDCVIAAYADSIGNGSENFYEDWQNSHTLGLDYFENKTSPDGSATYGAHNTQHITANRKAYAMWWILARIAGWKGD
jgi:hypothetical protein